MPGKHYKGMPKYKKKGMPKLSEKQAKHIDTNKDGKISGADFPINRGIGNYKGSGNFAMKNKVLTKSAKYGEPMQRNYGEKKIGSISGNLAASLAGGAGSLLFKKPVNTKDLGEDVTNDPRYKKAKDSGKKVYKSKTGQITTVEGVPNKRKARIQAERRKKAIEHAKTDNSFKSDLEKKTGKTLAQLEKENK